MKYVVNSDEWYPVYDPFVTDYVTDYHYELDDDLVRCYIAARDEHERLLDELRKAMDDDWIRRHRAPIEDAPK